MNAAFDLPNVYSIVGDEFTGVRRCVNYLYRRGRRKLLLLLDMDCPSSAQKENGFLAGCGDHEDLSGYVCRDIVATPENAERSICLALAGAPDCDAILCSGDMLAIICSAWGMRSPARSAWWAWATPVSAKSALPG